MSGTVSVRLSANLDVGFVKSTLMLYSQRQPNLVQESAFQVRYMGEVDQPVMIVMGTFAILMSLMSALSRASTASGLPSADTNIGGASSSSSMLKWNTILNHTPTFQCSMKFLQVRFQKRSQIYDATPAFPQAARALF
jgi:hypothetical protein